MFCLHEIKGTKVFREASLLLRLLIPPLKEPRIQRSKASLIPPLKA